MSDLFLHVFNIAVAAGWIVPAVLVLRLILRRRLPGWIKVALWGVVGVRLLCPFSLESVLSLIPSAEAVPPTITTAPAPQINVGLPVVDEVINPVISQTMAPVPEDSVNPMQVLVAVAAVIWLVGVAVMLIYFAVSAILLRRRLAVCVPYGENIYLCDHLPTPILVGILRPRIYIPSDTDPSFYPHVLAHEGNHMRRGDHIWKPLSFLLLSVYWFHPLLWVAYLLLGRDMEQACDEKTVKGMSEAELKAYLHALVACSDRKTVRIRPNPVGFGEHKIIERVKHMLSYKQPKLWITVASVVLVLVVAVCFLTNPVSANEPNEPILPPDGTDSTESPNITETTGGTNVEIPGTEDTTSNNGDLAWPADIITSIKSAYVAQIDTKANPSDLEIRSCGEYHGVYVFVMVNLSEEPNDLLRGITIGGVEFMHADDNTLFAYSQGNLERLAQAHFKGWVTTDDLVYIHNVYETVYPIYK